MNRFVTLTGIGAAIGAAAIAGGLGVALARGDHDDRHRMMGGAAMQQHMDPAAMQQHMKDALGEEAYSQMQGAMKAALGDDGYQQMLDRMATGCTQPGMGMMTPGSGAPAAPEHSDHHPATSTPTDR